MDRENLKDILKAREGVPIVWNDRSASELDHVLQGKGKKMWLWQKREEMLRIKSNINQELKLEEKRGGAHEQACSQAQSTHWPVYRKSFSLSHWLLAQGDGKAVGSACTQGSRERNISISCSVPCSGSMLQPDKHAPISSGSIQWPDTRASV